VGLTATHGRGHIVRAILEGVAFGLRETFTIFEEMKVPVSEIRLGGGGARSLLWRQIQADVYGHPVGVVGAEEAVAHGAAILGGVRARIWPDVDTACNSVVRVVKRTTADPGNKERMQRQYMRYRRIYPALKPINEEIQSTREAQPYGSTGRAR
jgi:xylulokinase